MIPDIQAEKFFFFIYQRLNRDNLLFWQNSMKIMMIVSSLVIKTGNNSTTFVIDYYIHIYFKYYLISSYVYGKFFFIFIYDTNFFLKQMNKSMVIYWIETIYNIQYNEVYSLKQLSCIFFWIIKNQNLCVCVWLLDKWQKKNRQPWWWCCLLSFLHQFGWRPVIITTKADKKK